ncbi:hypothetical protein WR25_11774 isoform G [Diploscapter pachys]|uniref:beta-N-acetylhexosaminidase n=1 Tax=Diploscapter pachys TaxID=2018661 RepID=A0A2A2J947_9BILA|nr:hypothetical protein WR25_11774 isoform E [Diploscapter pachys]PAV58146.1 hypothetical protein WR25_11774 isoform G [Diploscapter pachys]
MVDVGGQRNERGKWIRCFEGIDMILFIVAISDYDQLDPEDPKFNRLKQNYEIFKAVVQSDIFRHASIVLFLNKYDIFKEKLHSSPLSKCWKSYAGDNSEENARKFVERQFERCIKDKTKFYHFATTATDTKNIEYVFGSAISHIVSENLRSTVIPRISHNDQVFVVRRFKVECGLGAPVKVPYFKQLLELIRDLGATGALFEWEDMFPFEGQLADVRNGFAYSKNDVLEILSHANTLGLTAIPLVQTLGHMEWILKTQKFSRFREDSRYPMVTCIGNSEAVELILDSLNQVLELHSKFPMPYVHIGADEVFQIGVCEADKYILPIKYGNDTKKMMFDHLKNVAINVTMKYGNTKVLAWFDLFKGVDSELIQSFDLGKLIIPVVWKYTPELDPYLPRKMWIDLSRSFPEVWGGSAFKGADGSNQIWNRIKPYLQNNKEWFMQYLKYSEYFTDFHGIILTGWQRYDHFAGLCELWPTSITSLALNIKIVNNFILSEADELLILKVLQCPGTTTLKNLISNTDNCHFPGKLRKYNKKNINNFENLGHKVRDAVKQFITIKAFFDNSSWIHNRLFSFNRILILLLLEYFSEFGWLRNSHMKLNASNPYYIDAVGGAYNRTIIQLNKNMANLKYSIYI